MRRSSTPGIGALALVLADCPLGQRPPSRQVCTLIGCGPSLEVCPVGEHVPTDFTVIVNSSSRDFVKVRCTEGNAEFGPPDASRWAPSCPPAEVVKRGAVGGRRPTYFLLNSRRTCL